MTFKQYWQDKFFTDSLIGSLLRTVLGQRARLFHIIELIPQLYRHKDINSYERRRPEIENSDDYIVGEFYVYGRKIISSYPSERLYDDGKFLISPMPRMYISEFYKYYMKKKYKDLPDDPDKIPSGSSKGTLVFLDDRVFNDEHLRNQIIKLYRLDKEVQFLPTKK